MIALLINIDYTAVNLALITIAHQFHAKLNVIQWALAAYLLALAVCVVPLGQLADKFGAKKTCIFGISLFLIASIFAGLSNDAGTLIVARMVQGIAGAVYIPTLFVLIFSNFSLKKRGLAMGFVSMGVGLGLAIGPTFGGILLHYLNWRSIFFINVPIGLFAILTICFNAKRDKGQKLTTGIDCIGAILLAAAVCLIIFSLSKVGLWGVSNPLFWGIFLMGTMFLAVFVVKIAKYGGLIPDFLFKYKPYIGLVVTFLFQQYSFSAFMLLCAIYLQKALGLPVLKASLVFLFLTAIFGLIAPFGGYMVDKVGLRKPSSAGLFLMILGFLGFSFLVNENNALILYFLLVLMGVGMGLAFASLNSGRAKMPVEFQSSIASSVFLLGALLGNVLGIVVTSLLYENCAARSLFKHLVGNGVELTSAQADSLHDFISSLGNYSGYHNDFTSLHSHAIISQFLPYAISEGIHSTMFVTSIVLTLSLVIFLYTVRSNSAVEV